MKKLKLIFLFLVLFLIVFFVVQYFLKDSVSYQNPESVGAAEAGSLVEKVGALVLLPEGEVPTVATVSDLKALEGQSFFVDAKVGDKVLIYNKAKRAVLYDPTINKVINMAPINFNAQKL